MKITNKLRKVLRQFRELGTIYCLHRCSPIDKNNLYWNEHMKVSPEFLEKFLGEQRKAHDFISLDELVELAEPNKKYKRKFIIMTFDDGWLDNYEYALPIFDSLKIPFTVYITNSFPNRNAFLWYYVLEDILKQNKRIVLSDGKIFNWEIEKEKENLFLLLRKIVLNLNQENLIENFIKLFSNYKIDYASYNALCLSWDMIKEMSNNRWCTIGAHTMNHKTLNLLSAEQLDYEIINGKKELENHICKNVLHFAYPFGTAKEISNREINFIKEKTEFSTVCNAFGGCLVKENMANLLDLPRKSFKELKK